MPTTLKILGYLCALLLLGCGGDDANNRVVQVLVSPAGHKVHFMAVPEKNVSNVSFRFAWASNWPMHEEGNPALPHVASRLISSGGAAGPNPQDVLAKFEAENARGTLVATADYVTGVISFPKNKGDKIIPLVRDMLGKTEVSVPWLDRTKRNFEAEIDALQMQSTTQMWNAARIAVLGNTPIARFLNAGDVSDVKRITPQDFTAWHKETLNQANVTISVAGDISSLDALAFVDEVLMDLPPGENSKITEVDADFSARNILLHLPKAEKTAIGFLARLPNTRKAGESEDFFVTQLLNQPDGPLFQAVRTELGAAYGATAGIANYSRDIRVFFIFAEVEPSKIADARNALLEAYEAFRTDPDLAPFETLHANVVEGTKQNIRSVEVVSRVILELALDERDVTLAPNLASAFEAVTKESLAQRLTEIFPPADQLATFAVSADADALPGACVIKRFDEAGRCK